MMFYVFRCLIEIFAMFLTFGWEGRGCRSLNGLGRAWLLCSPDVSNTPSGVIEFFCSAVSVWHAMAPYNANEDVTPSLGEVSWMFSTMVNFATLFAGSGTALPNNVLFG